MSYLTQFDNLVRDERQMKALTGVSTQEFKFIVPHFQKAIDQIKEENYLKRLKEKGKKKKRKSGSGAKGNLDTCEKKLFYILNYIKTYPTFDIHGTNFGYARGHACDKAHELLWVLIRTLKDLGYAPKRKIESAEDFKEVFQDVDKLIADATERRHFRHKNYEKQKANYSGKKNATLRKTLSSRMNRKR